MSLSSAASLAQSGLNTVTAEISVLSRNISGASDTSIYSEKTANVITGPGGASQVASITRATNQAVFQNLLGATSANATQSALLSGINTLNETIGNLSSSSSSSTTSSASSPSALLSNFTDALQSYEASPSDSTLAGAAVAAAVTLAQGLNSATATVNQVREQADSGIATSVPTINSLLTQFQTANAQIVNGTATGADVTNAQDTRPAAASRVWLWRLRLVVTGFGWRAGSGPVGSRPTSFTRPALLCRGTQLASPFSVSTATMDGNAPSKVDASPSLHAP